MTAGLSVYPVDRLYEEVAFVAYHFNWDHDTVLAMPHWERQRWCEEISAINERINQASGPPGPGGPGGRSGGGITLEQEIPDEFWEDEDTGAGAGDEFPGEVDEAGEPGGGEPDGEDPGGGE